MTKNHSHLETGNLLKTKVPGTKESLPTRLLSGWREAIGTGSTDIRAPHEF